MKRAGSARLPAWQRQAPSTGPIGMIAAMIMARANRAAEAEAVAELAPGPGEDVLVAGFGPGVGLHLLAGLITDDLPWSGGSFDAVLTVNTIQLWRPFAASVREVARAAG
jgi:SAM-dependent methyltransferase